MADKSFILRYEIENGQVVIKGLDDIGAKHEQVAKRIKRASEAEATVGMRALNTAVDQGGQLMDGYVRRAGPFGQVLASMGKGGFAAAAAIGATSAAVILMTGHVGRAIKDMDTLVDTAGRLKIDVETLQALRVSARESGFDPTQADSSVSSLRDARMSALSGLRGSENSLKAFEALGISKGELRGLEDMDKLLARVSQGAREMGDQGRAVSVLWKIGLDAIADALVKTEGGLDGVIAHAKETGQVVDREIAQRAADINDKWEEMSQKLTVTLVPAFTSLAAAAMPVLEAIANKIRSVLDLFGQIQRSQEELLRERAQTLGNLMVEAEDDTFGMRGWMGGGGVAPGIYTAETLKKELFKTMNELAALKAVQNAPKPVDTLPLNPPEAKIPDIVKPDYAAANREEAEAARELAEAQRLVLEVSGKEAQINAKLKDTLDGLADARKRGVITSEAQYQSLIANAKAQAQADLNAASADRNKWLTQANAKAKDLAESLKGVDYVQEGVNGRMSAMNTLMSGAVRTATDLLGVIADLVAEFARMAAQGAAKGEGSWWSIFSDLISGAVGLGGGSGSSPSWLTKAIGSVSGRAGGGPTEAGKVYRWEEYSGEKFIMSNRAGYVASPHAAANMAGQQRQAAAIVQVAPKVELKVSNMGPPMEVEQRQTQRADGSTQIEAILRPMVTGIQKSNIASGRTDAVMRARTGARPVLNRR
ncbi:hypothetical protein sos41_11910 [Alphaproteobacteria bacterium SO-S41]|nr:hypothetical protein sos41_11910 [Alphaproteobacteria bacterium SO-S41]